MKQFLTRAFLVSVSIGAVCLTSLTAETPPIKEIRLVSDSWPEVTNADGTGLFFDVVRMVYEPKGIKVSIKIEPYARTVDDIKNKKADAWVASFLNEQDFAFYPKYHFDRVPQVALFQKNSPTVWSGEGTLKDKNVAMLRGFNLTKYIKTPMKVIEVDAIGNAIGMLEKGRIDYFLQAQPDIEKYMAENKVDMTKYKMEFLMFLNIFLAYTNDEQGKKLAEIWDTQMALLVKSPALKNLYKKYNYPWPFDK